MQNLIEKIAYENEFGTWMTGIVEDSDISDMVEKALKEERQQIADLKKERDAYYNELHAKRIEVEKLTAKLHEQYKYWELVKEGVLIKQYMESEAQNRELRKEVDELRDAVVKFQAELFEAVNNPNYKYEK